MPDPGAATEPPAAVIRRGAEFTGLMLLTGPGRIDGRFCGDLIASGLVWMGESSRVEARIEAEEVVLAGVLEGDVRASRRIELLPTARLNGNLRAPRVVLGDGCFVEGDCRTGSREEGVAVEVDSPPVSP
jgi:cytoskeletal protein CcmA (bactofilin family)